MEPPSTRPWLGVGAALSALPAAGACFCAALVLAVIADSDPGAVYEQHRWLGAIVAASAVCAYVAMMGWATLRHGGLPAPVLLIALALSGVPFLLPGGLFLPAAAIAVAGCAALATAGLQNPPRSAAGTRAIAEGLGAAAVVCVLVQAVGVGLVGSEAPPLARVLADPPHTAEAEKSTVKRDNAFSKPKVAPDGTLSKPKVKRDDTFSKPKASAPAAAGNEAPAPERPGGTDAAPAPAGDAGTDAAPAPERPGGTDAAAAPAGDALAATPAPYLAGPRRFVEDYYAALDAHRFDQAWEMLSPEVQRAFGGFAGWRKGYAQTVSHAPGGVTVTAEGASATVGLTLRAGDRGACGETVERRFAVTWQLARTEAGWRATAASARKISGPEPC